MFSWFVLLDTDALVNAAEGFEDHKPGILDEVVKHRNQKEVVEEHITTLSQLLLGGIKVKVDVQVLNKLSYGIPV